MHVGGIFCDLAKAFDWMNYEILLAKLHFFGNWGLSEYWFRSCLTNRRQEVEVKSPKMAVNFFSDWGTLQHGVPQGSVLLLLICINDLLLRMNSVSEPVLFADDASIIIASKNFKDFCSLSNLVLFHMIKWFAANNLVLNLVKTNVMEFITKYSSHSASHTGYKEECIEETVNTKFLG